MSAEKPQAPQTARTAAPAFVAGPGYRGAVAAAPERQGRRWRLAFGIALLVALLACGGLGFSDYWRQAERQVASVPEGQAAPVSYGRITLTALQAGTLFADARGKSVTAPPGTQIVVATFRVDFDREAESPYCRVELRPPDGRELARSGPDVAGPESDSCSPGRDGGRAGQSHQFQRTFIVPEDLTKDLSVLVFPEARTRAYVRFTPRR